MTKRADVGNNLPEFSTTVLDDDTIYSDPALNVKVTRFELESNPARITYYVDIAGQTFFSKITYHSIPSWEDLWVKCGGNVLEPLILGSVVAWDCMRFMALGGEVLELCDGLFIDSQTKATWCHCFLNQLGEWRYRNHLIYRSSKYPSIDNSKYNVSKFANTNRIPLRNDESMPKRRWLLTNGGGKDSLVGMMLMSDSGLSFDVYEGCLPVGGISDMQSLLLKRLRVAAAPVGHDLIQVTVEDNFFTASDDKFLSIGVTANHYKSDFAVGHTANYPGYYPLILYHGYEGVWFNIEASADRSMVQWNQENINHQWCKSDEYHRISTELFMRITGVRWFKGFSSTLRGLSDSIIYAIAATEEDLLRKTHSCNIDKPWCRTCPKCCFSYLMLCAVKSEEFALEVMGGTQSLFEMLENIANWRDLLDTNRVAWECVPSHEECLLAVDKCLKKGIRHRILVEFSEQADKATKKVCHKYSEVKWEKVPKELLRPTLARIGNATFPVECDVVIVGAGQSGLSMSYVLRQEGITHVVIESDMVGSSWNNRWDTFRLNTPNRTLALPGMQYEGADLDGFSTKQDVIDFLNNYAQRFHLPVISNNPVLSVKHSDAKYLVKTKLATILAKTVIVATGEYSSPRKPCFNGDFPPSINQIHSRDYRNADLLKPGAVLVVGGGQSGAQIAEDLHSAGRVVYWSLSDRPSNVRRIFGKDFMEWWDIGGILHRHIDNDPDVRAGKPGALYKARTTEFPLVSGNGGNGLGHSISLRTLSESGITLLGKLCAVVGNTVHFSRLDEQIERSLAGTRREYEKLFAIAKEYYGEDRFPQVDEGEFVPPEIKSAWQVPSSPTQVILDESQITNVIFTTGYRSEWPWLEISNVLDEFSYPLGHDGTSPMPGLYFLGMFNLQRLSSTCLCNQGRDAITLLPHLKKYLEFFKEEDAQKNPKGVLK